jgi:hypothetical protein
MLALLSNLNLVTRVELAVTLAERNKMLTGSLVTWAGAAPAAVTAQCVQVWSEANRSAEKKWEAVGTPAQPASGDGTPRFSPDVEDSGNVTCLYGKYRAMTNMFHGTPTVGQTLSSHATNGLLIGANYAAGSTFVPFGVCTKASTEYTHLGDSYTVIEYVTI